MRRFIALLMVLWMGGACAVHAGDDPKKQTVYMFGFAASFNDSVAYQTSLQKLDDAWLDKHKMLVDRSLYSLQLQYFLESSEKITNTTCTVFFGTNQNKMERMHRKVCKRYTKAEGLKLTDIPEERFRFTAEEWKPIIMEVDSTTVRQGKPMTMSKEIVKGKK